MRCLQGEQPAILDRDLFEAVQAKLSEQATNHTVTRMQSQALLTGRIFDDRGNRMSPSHARKGNTKYRYYLSSALLHGNADNADRCAGCRQTKSRLSSSSRFGNISNPPNRLTIGTHHIPTFSESKCGRKQLVIQLVQAQETDHKASADSSLTYSLAQDTVKAAP